MSDGPIWLKDNVFLELYRMQNPHASDSLLFFFFGQFTKICDQKDSDNHCMQRWAGV